jgi:hypothetical protein
LQDDTDRHERDVQHRNDIQARDSKPWFRAVSRDTTRRVPYAHPHGPRTRLQLDAPALSASMVNSRPQFQDADNEEWPALPADIRNVDLKHAEKWSDEPEGAMSASQVRKLMEDSLMRSLISDREFDFIAQCDADNGY